MRPRPNHIALESDTLGSVVFDFRTALVTIALVAVGLISLYSATYDAGASAMFTSQIVFALLGLVVMLGVAFVPDRWVQIAAWPAYGLSILLLLAVMVIGTEVNGAKSWIILGPISIQPSEFAKVGALLATAFFLTREGRDLANWRDLGLTAAIVGAPMLIVFKEDLGSATGFGALLLGVLLWGGADLFFLFAIVAPIAVAVAAIAGGAATWIVLGLVALGILLFRRSIVPTALALALSIGATFAAPVVFEKLPTYQQVRITVLFDQSGVDPQGYGYNLIQSMLAIGSGGTTGKGFLQGTQTQLRYVPEQYTDFIFSVIAEEFGLLGALLVIILLGSLIWFAVDTAYNIRSRFESLVCFGIAIIFFYHMSINIGMTMGLAPVIGIPLPFMSKGGSSLVVNMAMVGLLLNYYRYRADVKRA